MVLAESIEVRWLEAEHLQHECRCGGRQPQMAKLHDALAAYLWRVQGIGALGVVSAHYARGSDAAGFAAGASARRL